MKRKLITIISLLLALCLSACGVGAGAQGNDASDNNTDTAFDAEAYYKRLESCRDQIRSKTDFEPDIVVVLGTGLGGFADQVEIECEIPYSEIEGFPISTAPSHEGKLIFGTYKGKKLAVMKGRVHLYEGYDVHDVVLPIRVLHMLGANTAINTHSVGSLNEDYRPGEFMVSTDHISSFVPSPLTGANIEEFGPRFQGMENAYDKDLNKLIQKVGKENGIKVHSGVYIQVPGPQYETPAEIKMYREMGADTVGMSTVVEVIAEVHMGMRVCDINNITNMGAGMEENVTEELIEETAKKSAGDFVKLVSGVIEQMN